MTDALGSIALAAAERGLLPDIAIRLGIRRLCAARLRQEAQRHRPASLVAARSKVRIHASPADRPFAPAPEVANRQHYELPAEFFELVLGPTLKYSCCHWSETTETLEEAERSALELTCHRAEIEDGHEVLDLGCGWGSATLWIAANYPRCRVTAVSNSRSQAKFILRRARRIGLANLRVVTADVNHFDTPDRFDRVVSVEMFEHMRNHGELMRQVAAWLRPGGKLFVHVFCHREYAYEFESHGATNWVGRHFFTGGLMPSEDLLPSCGEDLALLRQWRWNGTHYQRTALAWLANLDRERETVLALFRRAYGDRDARRWFVRWRIFFLACAGLWGYKGGSEWFVAHYLFGTAAAVPERESFSNGPSRKAV